MRNAGRALQLKVIDVDRYGRLVALCPRRRAGREARPPRGRLRGRALAAGADVGTWPGLLSPVCPIKFKRILIIGYAPYIELAVSELASNQAIGQLLCRHPAEAHPDISGRWGLFARIRIPYQSAAVTFCVPSTQQ